MDMKPHTFADAVTMQNQAAELLTQNWQAKRARMTYGPITGLHPSEANAKKGQTPGDWAGGFDQLSGAKRTA